MIKQQNSILPSLRADFAVLNNWQQKKADSFSAVRLPFNGETNRLWHFHNVTQFRCVLTISGRGIFSAQQFRGDPERFHLFPNSHQFLLFCAKYIVRIFHRGEPRTRIQDSQCLSKITVSHLRSEGNLPEVHRGSSHWSALIVWQDDA